MKGEKAESKKALPSLSWKDLPVWLAVVTICLLVTLIVFTVYVDEVQDKLLNLFKSLDVKSTSIHNLKALMIAGTVIVWLFLFLAIGGAALAIVVRYAFVTVKRDAIASFEASGSPTTIAGQVPAFHTTRILLMTSALLVYIGALFIVGLVVVQTLILADMKVIRLGSEKALALTQTPAYAKIQGIQNTSANAAVVLNDVNTKISDLGQSLNSSVCGAANSVATQCSALTSSLADASGTIASLPSPAGRLTDISTKLNDTTNTIDSTLCSFITNTTSTCTSAFGKLSNLTQDVADRLQPAVEVAMGNSNCSAACFDVNSLWFVKHKPNNTCICVVQKIQDLYDWSVDAKTASEAATICIVIYLALWLILFWQMCTVLHQLVADWAWIKAVLLRDAAEAKLASLAGGPKGGNIVTATDESNVV